MLAACSFVLKIPPVFKLCRQGESPWEIDHCARRSNSQELLQGWGRGGTTVHSVATEQQQLLSLSACTPLPRNSAATPEASAASGRLKLNFYTKPCLNHKLKQLPLCGNCFRLSRPELELLRSKINDDSSQDFKCP